MKKEKETEEKKSNHEKLTYVLRLDYVTLEHYKNHIISNKHTTHGIPTALMLPDDFVVKSLILKFGKIFRTLLKLHDLSCDHRA